MKRSHTVVALAVGALTAFAAFPAHADVADSEFSPPPAPRPSWPVAAPAVAAPEPRSPLPADVPRAEPRRPDPLQTVARTRKPKSWADSARFFIGARGGVGVPPGGTGVAPTAGAEIGVAADSGFGLGLHFTSIMNPPDAPSLNIPKASWAIGAAADLRWYFQTVRPLTLYPTLSVGFLAGPSADNRRNVVLPTLNPGFGARVRVGSFYGSFEFGVMGFQVPFIAMSFGYEPERVAPPEEALD
jgi:hypothetical protein